MANIWVKYLAEAVLTPLSYLYKMVVVARNRMFDLHILPQEEFDVPVVVVGNLNAGGTGKTPHTEYIVEALSHDFRVGVLSRGYKRKSHGYHLATAPPTTLAMEPIRCIASLAASSHLPCVRTGAKASRRCCDSTREST